MEISQFSKGISEGKPLIPICCVCGKVRDIHNQWHMEVVPGDVILSHTYCPPCAIQSLIEEGILKTEDCRKSFSIFNIQYSIFNEKGRE